MFRNRLSRSVWHGVVASLLSLGVAYAAEDAPQPTRIQVVEKAFQLDGQGPAVQVYDVRFIDPDGRVHVDGYFGNKGEMFNAVVENNTSVPITMHWHGMIVPSAQDGVPNVSQRVIQPGGTKTFNFRLLQAGTYWMHSHEKLQEQLQLSAPLIISDKADPYYGLQEVVMFLEDFTYEHPEVLLKKLQSTQMNMNDMSNMEQQPDKASSKEDLNDIEYDAFLANKKTLNAPDVVDVKAGKQMRLRIINAGSSTNFMMDLGTLQGKLIAVDGEGIKPISGNRFPIGVGNRLDFIFDIPAQGGAFPILAQAEGRDLQAGLVLKTEGATVPKLSPKQKTSTGRVDLFALEKQLKTQHPLPERTVTKRLSYTLGGSMSGYTWSMNNERWPNITPSVIHYGDRVEVTYENKTGMSHPMHLHGHVFQMTEVDGQPLKDGAVRDSIVVHPNASVKLVFDAFNPGIWVNHCHNLYHLNAGMLTTIEYKHFPKPDFYLNILGARDGS